MKSLLIGVLALLWSLASDAQQRPELGLVVESLHQSAAACGIDSSTLESIAALALRNNGIQVVADSSPYLYARPSIIATPSGLRFVALNVSVRAYVSVPTTRFKVRGRSRIATNLSDNGVVLSDPASTMSKRFSDELEQQIKVCVGNLDY